GRWGCCSYDNGHSGRCNAALGFNCGEGWLGITLCDSLADCFGAGEVCCNAPRLGADCVAAEQCATNFAGRGPGDRLCADDRECAKGEVCCPYNAAPPTYRRCLPACP